MTFLYQFEYISISVFCFVVGPTTPVPEVTAPAVTTSQREFLVVVVYILGPILPEIKASVMSSLFKRCGKILGDDIETVELDKSSEGADAMKQLCTLQRSTFGLCLPLNICVLRQGDLQTFLHRRLLCKTRKFCFS